MKRSVLNDVFNFQAISKEFIVQSRRWLVIKIGIFYFSLDKWNIMHSTFNWTQKVEHCRRIYFIALHHLDNAVISIAQKSEIDNFLPCTIPRLDGGRCSISSVYRCYFRENRAGDVKHLKARESRLASSPSGRFRWNANTSGKTLTSPLPKGRKFEHACPVIKRHRGRFRIL